MRSASVLSQVTMSGDQRTLCPFCGMGCALRIRPAADSAYHGERGVPELGYDFEWPVNRGALCAKGNMTLELLCHPRRLESPLVEEDGGLRSATWDAALERLIEGLLRARERHGPGAVGILAGPSLTNVEAKLAVLLARHLDCANLDCCSPEDRAALVGPEVAGARPAAIGSVDEIEAMTAILCVGDLFTLAPCISRPVLSSRYDRRQNVLGVLDSTDNRTVWFGKPALICDPGRETSALALLLRLAIEKKGAPKTPWRDAAILATDGEDLASACGLDPSRAEQLVDALMSERNSGVLFAAGFAGRTRDVLSAGLAALLAQATGSGFLAMPTGPNTLGVRRVLRRGGFPDPAGLTSAEIVEVAATGDLKALLVLGSDPLAALPGRIPRVAAANLDLLAVTSPVPGETTAAAHVVLPSSVWGEKDGEVQNAFGDVVRLAPVLEAPGAAWSDAKILWEILTRMGATPEETSPSWEDEGQAAAHGGFFEELSLHFRLAGRTRRTAEAGTHLLLPKYLPPHAGDGWMTRLFTWPRHEFPNAQLSVSPGHAAKLGVVAGDRVRVRSREGAADLHVRIEGHLKEGVVLAPVCHPEVRRLVSWRLDPVFRDLDLRPARVSVEPLREDGDG